MFTLVAALGIATAPAVDLNSFPTDLTPVEVTVQDSLTGNRYDDFNGVDSNVFATYGPGH